MDEKVQYVLHLIDQDGDSFAKRAEMYYKRRPELINFVEEFYRAYRALAERYDRISGELQNANHTIATVFPEQAELSIDEEEEEDSGSPKIASRRMDSSKVPKQLPKPPNADILKSFKMKDTARSPKKSIKKMQSKRTSTSTVKFEMSNAEALQEIDKLQKGILTLQTEKEFIKSSYENRLAKYWEIEKRITEMQQRVCSLQDQYGVGTIIEDKEARSLMASAALQSCQETLVQLQEKQDRLNEDARVEYQRIKDTHEKLEALKDEFLNNQRDENMHREEIMNAAEPTLKDIENEDGNLQQERHASESIREKIREHFEINSNTSLTVPELAEKIDELVTKVVSLETAVSSQTALIKRVRSQTDDLQEHLRNLEEDKTTVLKDSHKLSEKLQVLEEEFRAVQDLNSNIENQNDNLQTHFTVAHCNLDHLSEKLKCVNELEEEIEEAGSLQEEASIPFNFEPEKENAEDQAADVIRPPEGTETKTECTSDVEEKDEEANCPSVCVKDQEEHFVLQPTGSDNLDGLATKESEEQLKHHGVEEEQGSSLAKDRILNLELQEHSDDEDLPNWQDLSLHGLDGREQILLAEYISILHKYKQAKKKLSEAEKKNRDCLLETTSQLRELKSSNAEKDDMIRSLSENLELMKVGSAESSQLPKSEDSQLARPQDGCNSPTVNSHNKKKVMFRDQDTEEADIANASSMDKATKIPPKEEKEEMTVILSGEPRMVSSIEEGFRREIDDLLEENLQFWLKFSTAFHQIQKFQTAVLDLQAEYLNLKEKMKQEGSTTSTHQSLKSDAHPIYKHMREVQTELTVWSEQNMVLKDELKYRLSSLYHIQEEISKVLKVGSGTDEVEFTSYQAAKFEGEILNMQQENNKVSKQLQAGLDHVKGLKLEIQKTLLKMDEDFKLSGSRNHTITLRNSIRRTQIPLRLFLFGAKPKKPKPSIFSCMNPALQKQYSDLQGNLPY